jgi:DNA-binding NtrC family response regulator
MPRMLVVDDQADVRAMLSIVLRVHGFETVEAGNAAAAVKAIEEASFDAVIVDIFLGGTNGFDLISSMRERVPDLAVVAISGMTKLDFVSQWSDLAEIVCLQKPFRPNDLIRAIEMARGTGRPSMPGDSIKETAAR